VTEQEKIMNDYLKKYRISVLTNTGNEITSNLTFIESGTWLCTTCNIAYLSRYDYINHIKTVNSVEPNFHNNKIHQLTNLQFKDGSLTIPEIININDPTRTFLECPFCLHIYALKISFFAHIRYKHLNVYNILSSPPESSNLEEVIYNDYKIMSELLIEEWNPIYNILNDNDFFSTYL